MRDLTSTERGVLKVYIDYLYDLYDRGESVPDELPDSLLDSPKDMGLKIKEHYLNEYIGTSFSGHTWDSVKLLLLRGLDLDVDASRLGTEALDYINSMEEQLDSRGNFGSLSETIIREALATYFDSLRTDLDSETWPLVERIGKSPDSSEIQSELLVELIEQIISNWVCNTGHGLLAGRNLQRHSARLSESSVREITKDTIGPLYRELMEAD